MLKLSKYIDETEEKWHAENTKLLNNFFEILNKKLNKNLYKKYNLKSSTDLYNYLQLFLLANHQKELYETFKEINIDENIYEKQILNSLILTIIRNKDNVNFLINVLMDIGFIKDAYKNNNEYFIETEKFGIISFKRANEVYKDEETKRIFNQKNLLNGCHEYSLKFLKIHQNTIAITAILTKRINLNYYHSFILDNDNIIDVANNIIMNKKQFYLLNDIIELNSINYQQYINQKDVSKKYDESKTLFELLRIAIYNELDSIKK